MTLNDLLRRLKSHLDHDAAIASQDDDLIAYINEVYEEATAGHRWLTLYRNVGLSLYVGVNGSAAATIGLPNGSNVVTGVGTAFGAHMEGQTMTVVGTTYRILGVASATSLYLTSANTGAGVVASEDWSIAMDELAMPRDIRDFENILDRTNNLNFVYVSRGTEASLQLDDYTGNTYALIEFQATPTRTFETTHAVTAGVGGSLAASTRYAYCATLERAARESLPTVPATGDTTAANLTVTVTGLNKTEVGDRLRLYRRNATTGSGWYLLRTWAPGVASPGSFADDGSVAVDQDTPLYFYEPRATYKMYPQPSANATVELQYIRRPARLVALNQAPELPEGPAHEALHHLAAAPRLLKASADLARWHEARGKTLLNLAAGSPGAVIRTARVPVRQPNDGGTYGGRWRPNYGTITGA